MVEVAPPDTKKGVLNCQIYSTTHLKKCLACQMNLCNPNLHPTNLHLLMQLLVLNLLIQRLPTRKTMLVLAPSSWFFSILCLWLRVCLPNDCYCRFECNTGLHPAESKYSSTFLPLLSRNGIWFVELALHDSWMALFFVLPYHLSVLLAIDESINSLKRQN